MIRDEALVESALASAENTFFYGHGDLFDIAASNAFHLTESQAFVEGNKQTRTGAAVVFLELNGVRDVPADVAPYDAMIAVANKQLSKSGFAAILQGHKRQHRQTVRRL